MTTSNTKTTRHRSYYALIPLLAEVNGSTTTSTITTNCDNHIILLMNAESSCPPQHHLTPTISTKSSMTPLSLSSSSTTNSVATTIGKYELLQSIYYSCPQYQKSKVDDHSTKKIIRSNNSNSNNSTLARKTTVCDCDACTNIRQWVVPSIPTILLQFVPPPDHVNATSNDLPSFLLMYVRRVSYATKNYIHFIQRIPSQQRNDTNQDPTLMARTETSTTIIVLNEGTLVTKTSGNDTQTLNWMGPWTIQDGDVLKFLVVPEHFTTTSGNTKNVALHTNPPIPPSPLHFQCCLIQPPNNTTHDVDVDTIKDESTATVISVDNDIHSCHHQALMNIVDPSTSTTVMTNDERTNSKITMDDDNCNNHTSTSMPLPLPNINHYPDGIVKSNHDCATQPSWVLYFVPKGTDMHPTIHITKLHDNAIQRGATILPTFDYSKYKDNNVSSTSTTILHPTHFILSTKISNLESIATVLGFSNMEEMSGYLQKHNVVCATREWAAEAFADQRPYEKPTLLQLVPGFSMNRKRRKLQSSDNEHSIPSLSIGEIRNRNRPLSDVFRKLAKLHQDCPLYVNDDWKSYMFQLVSGRILHLDFVVTTNDIDKLSQISGFGASTIQIIKEFLDTGVCNRIVEFENDSQRKAMNVMMQIWGVGRVRATELVTAGYRRIGDVKQALMNGTLHFDRNQYIGLICYDDINERMSRTEVEAIATIIKSFVQNRHTTSAETVIMGSYRRGKETCGDVDILITHPDYIDTVPSYALGEIVDELCTAGHVAFHLTYISGMKPELYETLPAHVAKQLTHPKSYGRSKEKKDKYSMSSWMGVMNSPLIPGKRRRVDIKFYPYSERYFASLYFTGNGHFNRSMRLYATRKYNYMLSDHGLIDKSTERPIIYHPTSERDIFDVLGLQWKETNERECFDDVKPYDDKLDGSGPDSRSHRLELTREEVTRDSTEHVWID